MRKRFIVLVVIGVAALVGAIVGLGVAMARLRRNTNPHGLVVIIGAGMSGASAAESLEKAGQRFLILEARNEVGGRMMRATIANQTVELGANWIHGYEENGAIEKLATSLNLSGVPTDFRNHSYYSGGESIDGTAGPALRRFEQAWKRAVPLANKDDESTILDALAKHGNWRPENGLDCAMLQFTVDYLYGLSANNISAYRVEADAVDFTGFEPSSERFVKDDRGYNILVHELLKRAGVNDTKKSGDKLMLNATVRAVSYNSTGANITLSDGRVVNARVVISTVSLGVLQSGIIEFRPPLPESKKTALSKMAMSSYTKIYISFKEAILTEADPLILIPTRCIRATNIQNLNKKPFFPGSNAVLVTVLSDGVTLSDGLSIALEAVNHVVEQNVTMELVSDYVFRSFDADEHFRGAYSNRLVGFTEADQNILRTPDNTMYLAGEMVTKSGNYGSVKAAFTSGKEVAELVMSNS